MRNHANLPSRVAADLQGSVEAAAKAPSMDELRGHEGNAAAIYFANFAGMFKQGVQEIAAKFNANGRKRRPPPDPVNSVLSFAYSMITNECVAALRLASLEPTIGALHATRPGRPALALDLVEPFRPLIADSVAVASALDDEGKPLFENAKQVESLDLGVFRALSAVCQQVNSLDLAAAKKG